MLKFSAEGKPLLPLGKKGEKGEKGDGPDRFTRPTGVAVLPSGEFYVADGYGNALVMMFSKEGKLLKAWGKKGTGNGEFNLPDAVCMHRKCGVSVGDRENNRAQGYAFVHSMRGPLLISGPRIPAGKRSDTLPSLNKLCGVLAPKAGEGIELTASLSDLPRAARSQLLFVCRNVHWTGPRRALEALRFS